MNPDFKPKFIRTKSQRNAVKRIVSSKARNFCIYGGSRSGKSFIIMRMILIRASKCPNSSHLIVRETLAAVKRSIWKKTLPDVLRICFPNLKVKLNKTDYECHLPNGSVIYFAGLDDNEKVERLLGTEYSTLWFNESNQIVFPAVSKLRTRLAEKNSLKNISFYDLNPTHTSSWVYQQFEEGVNPQDGEMLEDPENYVSIQMNIRENLDNVDEDYLNMLEKMPAAERKRFLDGEYDDSNAGKACYSFYEPDHVSEDAIKLPGTIQVGSDFNIDYNSDVIGSQHANGLFIWDEVQIAGDTIQKCDALIKKGAKGATVTCDSTGKNRRTSGRSDHIILKDAGFRVEYKTNPAVRDKITNLNRCLTLGLIKIHPRCKKLIRDLKQLTWDKHGNLNQKTDPSLSHLVDSLAYLCWRLYPLTGTIKAPVGSQRR